MAILIFPLQLSQAFHLLPSHEVVDAFQVLRYFLVAEFVDLSDEAIQEIPVV